MHSTAWVDQFQMKVMRIEFVINNASAQGNNDVKIKLNIKVKEIC